METGFGYGVETITDVLKARRDLVKAKYGYVKNRMHFLQAIGTIGEKNLEEMYGWLQHLSVETSNSNEKNGIQT